MLPLPYLQILQTKIEAEKFGFGWKRWGSVMALGNGHILDSFTRAIPTISASYNK